MKRAAHVLFVIGVLFLALVFPFLRSEKFSAMTGNTDTTSSATVVLDAPSGEFVVLLNRELHEKNGSLAEWTAFFSGEEIGIIFEDISCGVAQSDAAGLDFARSLQSRLPENQMTIYTENGTLLLSKAEYGKFDVVVLSKEAAKLYGAATLYGREEVLALETGVK